MNILDRLEERRPPSFGKMADRYANYVEASTRIAEGLPPLQPLEAHKEGEWAVYFLLAERCQRVKIGTTRYLSRRLKDLEGASPDDHTLFGWVRGGHAVERLTHRLLQDSRAKGEWFDMTPEVRAFIDQLDPLFS